MTFQGSYEPVQVDTAGRPWLRPKPCGGAAGCQNPARRYAGGWRCGDHPPVTSVAGAFTTINGRLFDGTEFKR